MIDEIIKELKEIAKNTIVDSEYGKYVPVDKAIEIVNRNSGLKNVIGQIKWERMSCPRSGEKCCDYHCSGNHEGYCNEKREESCNMFDKIIEKIKHLIWKAEQNMQSSESAEEEKYYEGLRDAYRVCAKSAEKYKKQEQEIYNKAIYDFVKVLLTNEVVDKSVVRRLYEQTQIRTKDLFYRKG